MSDVTEILSQLESGDPHARDLASEQLLPLVYEELRRLARSMMANEPGGQTLQPTALVHEAYIRLLGGDAETHWNSRGHFFGAAARAIRRILVENARRKSSTKHGGQLRRAELADFANPDRPQDVVALDGALEKLAMENEQAAKFVELRYFGGFSLTDSAEAMELSPRAASRLWAYSRSWILREIQGDVLQQ